MATINQIPDSLSLLRNLKPLIATSSSPIVLTLVKDETTLIEETYHPDPSGKIEVDLRELVAPHLKTVLPTSDIYEQASGSAVFVIQVDEVTVATFRVVNAGVRKLSTTPTLFLKANWLTWQPQVKKVTWDSPETLSYFFAVAGVVKAKFYLKAGSSKTITIGSYSANAFKTFNTRMSYLFELSGEDTDDLYGYVDVWVETSLGVQLSYVQRYVFEPKQGDEKIYLCENSLGGIDTFIFRGALTQGSAIEHASAAAGDTRVDITSEIARSWEQKTGALGIRAARWVFELLSSRQAWAIQDGNAEPIVISADQTSLPDSENVHSLTFTYTLSEQRGLQNYVRTTGSLSEIVVESPSGDIFFLRARLADFPAADLADEILFLAQTPFTEEWKKVSLSALAAAIGGGGGGGTGDGTWEGHFFDDWMDQPVRTTDDVEFHKVETPTVESPSFSEGALGAGFRMYVNQQGRAELELDDIVVRRSMKVFELIIQQIKHQGGMVIWSAASMECSRVEQVTGGYKCYFDSKDGQIPNEFVVGDQARCQRFDLGTTTAKYYWRLVTAVGDDYIILSATDCDADSDVPAAGDNIVQLGNRNNTSRQSARVTTTIDANSPRDDYYKGINSYDLTGKLITTVGVRNGEVGIFTENGEFKGQVTITGGSGLQTLTEWNDMSWNISSAWQEALSASAAAGAAQLTANQAVLAAATAQGAADAAAAAAQALGTQLADWANDGKISPVEKEALRQQKADVSQEYTELVARATRYSVGYSAFTTAYTAALAALTKYTATTPAIITIESDYADIAAYYTARVTLLDAIAAAEKNAIDSADTKAANAASAAAAAQSTADAAASAASAAQSTADSAASTAATANSKLSDWASDSKISPAEKEALRQQKADVVSEHTAIVQEAGKYGIATSSFTAAYNAAITAFDKYTAATPEMIAVGTDYADIAAYYTARATIAQSIATAAKQVADAAQAAADAAQAEADAASAAAAAAQGTADLAVQRTTALEAAIAAINSDTVLDLLEKNVIRTQWVVINGTEDVGRTGASGSYIATKALAGLYGNIGTPDIITYHGIEVTYNGEHIYYNITGLSDLDAAYLELREFLRGIGLNDREHVFEGFDRDRFAALLRNYNTAEIHAIDNVNRALSHQLSEFEDTVERNIAEMQDQLDNTIDYWFYDYAPTTSNYPASSWSAADKETHLGDIFYDNTTGLGYRWQKNAGGTYYWNQMQDDAAARALAAAARAQDTADGKRRVFRAQPQTADAYDPGDLWLHATAGQYSDETLVCKTAKTSGSSFSIAHWERADKYTDDTVANAAHALAATAKTTADSASATAQQASATAEAASAAAAAATTQLTNWANDGKISPVEKPALRQQKANIVSEHTALAAEATAYGISVTSFNAAYTAAIAALDKYSAATPEVITIESDYADIAAYYTARATIAQAVADAAKAASAAAASAAATAQAAANTADGKAVNAQAAADAAAATAAAAASAASAAQSTADSAASAAATANSKLSDWANDNKISPVEKQALRQQKADVISEHTALAAEATAYGISVTSFNAAYNAAITAFDKYTAATPEIITVGTDYADIAAYYTARTTIAQAVAEKSKEAADAAADAAEDASAAAEEAGAAAAAAQEAADAVAAAVEEIDLDVRLDEAEKAAIRVTWTAINGIPSTGSAGKGGTYHAAKIALIDAGGDGHRAVITYSGTEVLYNTAHIYYNITGENRLDAAYLALREYLNGCQIGAPGAFIGFNRETYAELIRDYQVALNNVLQILSDVAKDKAAAADAKAAAAGTAAGAAQDTADAAAAAAAAAATAASNANTALTNWASDGWISPVEKRGLQQQRNDIAQEYSAIADEAGKYSISTSTFASKKELALAVLDYYTAGATWTQNTQISSSYPLSRISDYYAARTAILESIATAAKKVATDAQADADAANDAIDVINSVLSKFASDGYVSPMEKRTLQTALNDEAPNYSAIAAQAGQYLTAAAISTIGDATLTNALQNLLNTFNAKYYTTSGNNAFRNVILYYTQDAASPNHSTTWAWEDNVPVTNGYPLSAITDYYTARENLVKKINEAGKAYNEKYSKSYTDAEIAAKITAARNAITTEIGNASSGALNSAKDYADGKASAAYNAAVADLQAFGETIISGGYIKTDLINTAAIVGVAAFIDALTSSNAFIEALVVKHMRTKNDKVIIQSDGTIKAIDVDLSGKMTATSGSITDLVAKRLINPFTPAYTASSERLEDDTMYKDSNGNISLSGYLQINLPWDTDQSGRRLCYVGSFEFRAPSNANHWYYENGNKVKSFKTSYEITEFIGLGTTSKFFGWLVVNRSLLATGFNHGRDLRPLAYGKVQGTGSSVSFVYDSVGGYMKKIRKFNNDNDDIYVSRGGVGIYYLWLPQSWFVNANHIFCQVSGMGAVAGASAACFANVYSVGSAIYNGAVMYRVEVRTADDASLNDGGFQFMIYNLASWDD